MHDAPKRLYRSTDDRIVGGVCGGLGAYLGMDPTVVRLAWVLVSLVLGGVGGAVVYVLALVLVSEQPSEMMELDAPPLQDSLDVRAWASEVEGVPTGPSTPEDGI